MTNLIWHDALAFCRWLSAAEGREYRLPSEAQWEYACRAGLDAPFAGQTDPTTLAEWGNIADAAFKQRYPESTQPRAWNDGFAFTSPVGTYRANAFGLFDMHGNVYEWCYDWFDGEPYAAAPQTDPVDPAEGKFRVRRGGSWYCGSSCARAARRESVNPLNSRPNVGFRVICTIPP